jgi:hypothetical protein
MPSVWTGSPRIAEPLRQQIMKQEKADLIGAETMTLKVATCN